MDGHPDDHFSNELASLIDNQYQTVEEAERALVVFMNKTQSSMHIKETTEGKTERAAGRETVYYRCGGSKDCPFRLKRILSWGGVVSFSVMNDRKHSDHPLQPPSTTSALSRVTKLVIDTARLEGREGPDLTNTVVNRMNEIGCDVTSHTVTYLRRKLQSEKLRSRILKNTGMTNLFQLGDQLLKVGDADQCEISLHASAVLGMLATLQQTDDKVYIRTRVVNYKITYVFLSTRLMRLKGSLFGEMRLFDDKHGVSSAGYHLAACTVQTNNKIQPVAFALMASSDGASWNDFIFDCNQAFSSRTGETARPWIYSIADGDGQIDSAIISNESRVVRFRCFFHFMKEVRSKNLSSESQWQPVHSIMQRLLECDRAGKCDLLIHECQVAIDKIVNITLREKHTNFLLEIVSHRLLFRIKGFTNGWTSQSASECTNSILEKLGVGPSIPLPLVLDKVLNYIERVAKEKDRFVRQKLDAGQAKLLAPISHIVTRIAFDHILKEYGCINFVSLKQVSETHYNVYGKKQTKLPRNWSTMVL